MDAFPNPFGPPLLTNNRWSDRCQVIIPVSPRITVHNRGTDRLGFHTRDGTVCAGDDEVMCIEGCNAARIGDRDGLNQLPSSGAP
ncbi:MAG: hypothetical protein ACI9W2_003163 [Gammaproteobacteria bacterium]|jgi:hypothetical protein